MSGIAMDDEMFRALTEYCNKSDNLEDDTRRAEAMGLGGRDILVAPGAIVRVKNPQKLGRGVFVGLYSYLNGDVCVGDHVLIGPHCALTAGHHKFDPATGWFSARTEGDGDNSIIIGAGSWLAAGVTVTAGVKIGRCNLICANAVVTKDTPDYAIVAGVPACVKGHIDPQTGAYHWCRTEVPHADA